MRAVAVAAAAVALLLVGAGCGGGDGGDPKVRVPEGAPEPVETAEEALERLQVEVEERRCERPRTIFHSSRHHFFEGPPGALAVCRSEFGFFPDLRGAVAKAHGTGAIASFPGGERPAVVLALDRDRRYRYVTGAQTGGVLGADADRLAVAAIAAMARDDCPAFMKVVDAQGLSPKDYCTGGWGRPLRRVLGGRRPTPVRMGSSQGVAFYALRVDPRRYFTVMVEQSKRGPLYSGAVPAQ